MSALAQAVADIERELDALDAEAAAWRELARDLQAEAAHGEIEAAGSRARQLETIRDHGLD